jgi:transcriptional regulator PpsR
VKHFRTPGEAFGHLDTESATRLIAAASELTLVVGSDGAVRDVVCNDDVILKTGCDDWVGRPWIATVTPDSRKKVELLINEAVASGPTKSRQVNHPLPDGTDVPVLYFTIRIPATDRIMAVGRNLATMGALQQSLLEAQQSMEREYSRLRHAEGRYRLLFRTAPDAILVVGAADKKIVEANPTAGRIFGRGTPQLVGEPVGDGFESESARLLDIALARLQATGRSDDVRMRLGQGHREVMLSAAMFRQDNTSMFLIRLSPVSADNNVAVLPGSKSKMLQLIEHSTDGCVVTDLAGRILMVNTAFLDLAQIASEEQVRGESLDRWLGRSGVDLNLLMGSLRQHGTVRLFATTLRGEHGTTAAVEISAVSILNSGQPYFGFTIRDVERRLTGALKLGKAEPRAAVPRSLEQLAELVGRVSLKELVRESTDVIERLCIEAALELTGDNRASAAELLGVSRQSLYMKLRRYGLGDLAVEGDVPD